MLHLGKKQLSAHLHGVGRPPMTITSHFRRAADHNPVTYSAASSAVSWTTPSANTTWTSHQKNLPTVSQLGQRYPTKASVPQTAKRSASTTISTEPLSSVPIPTVDEPIFAHSAAPNLTTHFHGPVAHAPYGPLATLIEPPFSESAASSRFLFYRDFSVLLHIEKLLLLQIRTLWSLSTIFILELFIHTIQMLLTILFPSMDCLLFIPFLLQTLEMASL